MKLGQTILRWVNLRPEESERTFLMFVAYTAISIGILWLEIGSAALFLTSYGAEFLPWIYIASAGIGFGLNFVYSGMQRFVPLRRVIVIMPVLMALPLLLFRVGLGIPYFLGVTIFVTRLWMEAIFALNELNTAVTANQIFNIREIKRTYPLISSGNLVSDVVSGFSLPLILALLGLQDILVLACLVMLLGAGMLFYLSQAYQQAFPDLVRRQRDPKSSQRDPELAAQRLRGPLLPYVIVLSGFFILSQVLYLLIDFQYLSQLELNLDINAIAGFLGLFSGILGLVELLTQWFISSRAVERMGIFFNAALLPTLTAAIALLPLLGVLGMLVGLVALKFVDELLRYTLIASMTPVLFQPIPSRMQPRVQSLVRGIAEPLSMGGAGLGFLLVIAAVRRFAPPEANLVQIQSQAFVLGIVVVALIWLGVIYLLRSRYLELLVVSAERGELSTAEGNIRSMRQAMIEALARPGNEADKGAYVDLLSSLDPYGASEVLASLLPMMSPALQQRSLKVMLEHPKTIHLETVRSLDQPETPPEVRALALRYAWLTEENPNVETLLNQLTPDVNPVVRGTAAAIVLRQGNLNQRDTALMVVQNMLVSPQEQERIMGCQALADMGLVYPEFRSYIRGLLRDKSLAVRQEVLDAIATLRLQEYYPSLLRGLYYKSTREAATQALSHLGDEGIPMLVQLAEDPLKPEAVRFYAWSALGRMGTEAAMDALVLPLRTIWGNRRRTLLRAILRLPDDQGIEAVLDRLRRSGVELMLDQELMFLGQMIAAMQDLRAEKVNSQEAELLRRGLLDLQTDGIERLFLLMRFLYPAEAIQAAEFGILRSGSFDSMARGLEILDNTLDIPSKRALLEVLDQRPLLEKLHSLSDLIVYYPLAPSDRLRFLLDLRHFLSDWVAACCYHLACEQRWSLTPDQVLAGLRHPTGFVREAVLAYLEMASPRSLKGLLPHMSQDPDPLVMAQVRQLVSQYRE